MLYHDVDIAVDLIDGRVIAICRSCEDGNWRGPRRTNPIIALADAHRHFVVAE